MLRKCLLSALDAIASVLQKAEVRIINKTVCNKLMDDGITPRMICAGVLSGGVDACQVKWKIFWLLTFRYMS